MKPIRALVVDDEPLALGRMTGALRIVPDVEVVGATTSAASAVNLIASLRPDALFLDVTMPGLDGFDVIARIPAVDRPAVVFVTAYEKFAANAFEAEAIDYLLKPVSPERLSRALDRVRQWLGGRANAGGPDVHGRSEALAANEPALWSHRHNSFERVPVPDIIWVEAQGDYVRLHTREGGGLVRATLSELEKKLGTRHFIRVHRSAICRKDAIVKIRRKLTGALAVTLANGDEAPLGRTYSGGLRAFLTHIATDGEVDLRTRNS